MYDKVSISLHGANAQTNFPIDQVRGCIVLVEVCCVVLCGVVWGGGVRFVCWAWVWVCVLIGPHRR